MKSSRFLCLILLVTGTVNSISALSGAIAQTVAPTRKGDSFSVKGVVFRVDPEAKILHVRKEAGLELTYHVDDSTQIMAEGSVGETPGRKLIFSELALGDSIEIEYRYNENYEKIALSIRKFQPTPTPRAPQS